jgi:YD repeat-containing protein
MRLPHTHISMLSAAFRVPTARTVATLALLSLIGALVPSSVDASGSYSYDMLGRLTTALYDNGTCVAYAYDANGNRTSQTITLSGAPTSPVWGSGIWGCFSWTPQ